jgi:prepilin-type N-terminal cleavage/methylation domain-containing protein
MEVLMLNKRKGFTLVEVIVVAVIVAVLAAVAIPLYIGYVADARVNQCENAAGSVASFCGACVNSGGTVTDGDYAPSANITCSVNATTLRVPDDVTVTVTNGTPGLVTAAHDAGETSEGTYNF